MLELNFTFKVKKICEKVLQYVLTNLKINNIIQNVVRTNASLYADVAELVDAQDLKSCG